MSNSEGFKRLLQLDGSLLETFMMFTAELLGTAILVFIGCLGCIIGMDRASTSMQIPLTFGLAITVSLTIFGHISGGHINPAVTIAAVILGKMSLPTAGIYIVGQCLGSLVGYGLMELVTPEQLRHIGNLELLGVICVTQVSPGITIFQGLAVEILATWILILVCGAVWDSRNEEWSGGISIKLGLTVTVLAMAAAPWTGCSMNPARSFGPAVWTNNWKDHWIYWVGPCLGSVLGSLNYLMYEKLVPSGQEGNGNAGSNP